MRNADLHGLIDRLPEDVVRRVEQGIPVTLVVTTERGRLEMREIDPEQAWFWTPEWQKGEREADEDIAFGRGARYDNDEELLAALEADLKPLSEWCQPTTGPFAFNATSTISRRVNSELFSPWSGCWSRVPERSALPLSRE